MQLLALKLNSNNKANQKDLKKIGNDWLKFSQSLLFLA
jgi:hypothetical protein